ncbi:MAG TPA: hypothetical protein VGB78_07900 [Thermoplasmata archaeon]
MQLRTVAALSVFVAALMLAQPVLAGKANTVTVTDAKDDLKKMYFLNANYGPSWPDNSPIELAECLDVKEASISKQKDTFVLTMTMWCNDLLADLYLPPGTSQIGWGFGFDTDSDYYSDVFIGVLYDGCTVYNPDPTELSWKIAGATIEMSFDEDIIGDPATIAWNYYVMVWWAPRDLLTWGGWWAVDYTDSWLDTKFAFWPA